MYILLFQYNLKGCCSWALFKPNYMYKSLQIHAVPTDKGLGGIRHKLWYAPTWQRWNSHDAQGIPHFLYVTLDNEIKEGDWGLIGKDPQKFPAQCPNNKQGAFWKELGGKKIVATDNPELLRPSPSKLGQAAYEKAKWLPSLPQDLIQAWVDSQGKLEIEVEYEEEGSEGTLFTGSKQIVVRDTKIHLKLNSSGEIIWRIKEQKKKPDREQMRLAFRAGMGWGINSSLNLPFDEWFDKNYPI
jgi:hypothetical protein